MRKLTIREAKSTEEKERYKHLNPEFQIIARRDKKAFLAINDTGERRPKDKILSKIDI